MNSVREPAARMAEAGSTGNRRLLFVVTADSNFGDLALCREWMRELGAAEYQYAFVLDEKLSPLAPTEAERFHFDRTKDVEDTILQAAGAFQADALLFATGACWRIPGQPGAVKGRFPQKVLELGLPVFSFDPFEGMQFHPPPAPVVLLRDSPNPPASPAVRHFGAGSRFDPAQPEEKSVLLRRLGLPAGRRLVMASLSSSALERKGAGLAEHCASIVRVFELCRAEPVHFLVIGPSPIPEFARLPNVTQSAPLPFDEFRLAARSMDLVLSNSGLATVFLEAACAGIPAALLLQEERAGSKAATQPEAGLAEWLRFSEKLGWSEAQAGEVRRLLDRHGERFLRICRIRPSSGGLSPLELLEDMALFLPEAEREKRMQEWPALLASLTIRPDGPFYLEACLRAEARMRSRIEKTMDLAQWESFLAATGGSLLTAPGGRDPLSAHLLRVQAARIQAASDASEELVLAAIEQRYHLAGFVQRLSLADPEQCAKKAVLLASGGPARDVARSQREKFRKLCQSLPSPREIMEELVPPRFEP